MEEDTAKTTTPSHNRQFGASGGVASWDTSQEFGSSPPVRALPIPPPAAKLLKRCAPAVDTTAYQSGEEFVQVDNLVRNSSDFLFGSL